MPLDQSQALLPSNLDLKCIRNTSLDRLIATEAGFGPMGSILRDAESPAAHSSTR